MIIESLNVKWFRSIVDETLDCMQLTALLGPNSCGKSSFLRALDLFYSTNPKYNSDDFYAGDTTKDIKIEVKFTKLTAEEKERFGGYIEQGHLRVVRIFSLSDGRFTDKCYGYRLQNEDFRDIRALTKASEQKPLYEALLGKEKYSTLVNWIRKDDALASLVQWEREHPESCTHQRDNGEFFCLKTGNPGDLAQYTKFIFIPAVRDASNDATEGKGAVITELMDLVVRNTLATRTDIKEFKNETQRRYDEIFNPDKLLEVKDLATKLTSTLNTFVPGSAISLSWTTGSKVDIPWPKADVRVIEDGYLSDITRKGHGFQRAFIVTILQHLAVAQPPNLVAQEELNTEDTSSQGMNPQLPTLILVIEEPELYQHPSRQRHFANILLKLAGGNVAGVAQQTQVLYCTHSPLFVGIDRFDELRLLKKVPSETVDAPKITKVTQTTLKQVAEIVWIANGSTEPPYTEETLRSRLHSLMTPWTNEGFFADVVVLVEGEDDRVAILAMASMLGHDLESLGISVIPCNGKSKVDKIAAIFHSLEIPLYVIWDSDHNQQKPEAINRAIKENACLLRLMGRTLEDWPSKVTDTFACFDTNLDIVLRQEIGENEYDTILQECQDYFAITKAENAKKNPAVISMLLEKAYSSNKKILTLEKIIKRIVDIKNKNEVLKNTPQLATADVLLADDELPTRPQPVLIRADVL